MWKSELCHLSTEPTVLKTWGSKVFHNYLNRQKLAKKVKTWFSLPVHRTMYKDNEYVSKDKEEEISEKSRTLLTD